MKKKINNNKIKGHIIEKFKIYQIKLEINKKKEKIMKFPLMIRNQKKKKNKDKI